MKKLLSLLLTLFFGAPLMAQDRMIVEGEVEEVNVYTQGAQVTRSAKVDLDKGMNEVMFKGLSTDVDPNTIQVLAKKGLSIRSVEYSDPKGDHRGRKAQSPEMERVQDSLEDVEFKLSLRKSLEKVYAEERSLILENKNIKGEQTGVDIDDLMELAQYYRKRLKNIEYKLIELREDIEALSGQKQRLDERIRKIRHAQRQKQGRIRIRVDAPSPGGRELRIVYFARNAGWEPAYEIRCKDAEGPIELVYKGRIHQSTGTDWKEVELTLSTGDPLISGTKPEPSPWYVNSYAKNRKDVQHTVNRSNVLAESSGSARPRASQEQGRSFRREDRVVTHDQGVSTAFEVEALYSIPSNGKEHSVTIKQEQLPASYRYYVAPRMDKSVFLLAKVTDWEAMELLPGKAGIYYQGAYVGHSRLDPNITQDTLELSLGRDKRIVVERERVKNRTRTSIIGGKKKLTMEVELDIRNNRSKPIDLMVQDQIPRSRRADVDVELVEKGGARFDERKGYLKWVLPLEPQAERTLTFTYSITYPKDEQLFGL